MNILKYETSFSWEILGHVTLLNQSRVTENIWWIIERYILLFKNCRVGQIWMILLK